MAYSCYNCGKDLSSELSGGKAGRSQSCPKCTRDLRCCRNCKHYDTSAYNQCREPNADRVVDKEKSNFCDYHAFSDKAGAKNKNDPRKEALKNLDDLFKK